MARRNPQALRRRRAQHRPRPALVLRQITCLAHQDVAVAQLVRDAGDVVDDVLAAGVVARDLGGAGRQRDERVAFAAGVEFIVGARVDLGGYGCRAGFGAGFEVFGEVDVGEEGVGGDGAGRADGDAVGAQRGDGGFGARLSC